jgi:amidohydrolase
VENIGVTELKRRVIEAIDSRDEKLIEISHAVHEHPEVAFDEYFAHATLTDALQAEGLPVVRSAYDVETAFSVEIGSGDFCVAIVCEYDALPGIGHACGHNVIAAAGLGAGVALAPIAESHGFKLKILGTPAEEAGGGKVVMARAGAFADVGAAMMVHPADADIAALGFLAIQSMKVTFSGLAAHASVSPHKGKNALDAAVLGYMGVAALRQHILPSERIHGIFVRGGERPNIVPRETEMEWYVRSPSIESLQPLKKRVIGCFNGAAQACDCHVKVEFDHFTAADVKHNVPMLNAYVTNAQSLGRSYEDLNLPSGGSGSTDMGNISYIVPSIHPMIQIAPSGVALHTTEFADFAAGPQADDAVLIGAKLLAMTAIDAWSSSELRAQLKENFGSPAASSLVL